MKLLLDSGTHHSVNAVSQLSAQSCKTELTLLVCAIMPKELSNQVCVPP